MEFGTSKQPITGNQYVIVGTTIVLILLLLGLGLKTHSEKDYVDYKMYTITECDYYGKIAQENVYVTNINDDHVTYCRASDTIHLFNHDYRAVFTITVTHDMFQKLIQPCQQGK